MTKLAYFEPRSDADLLRSARTEPSAFCGALRTPRFFPHAFHLSCCGDREAALDLTAETFAQAWLSRVRFRDRAGGSAKPWLFTIARNVLVSGSPQGPRGQRRATSGPGRVARPGPDPSRAGRVVARRPRRGLREPAREPADAIQLRVVDELPYRESQCCSGRSPQAARVRVHRGLADLRSRFAATDRRDGNGLTPELDRLGDALERAAERDVTGARTHRAGADRGDSRSPPSRSPSRIPGSRSPPSR